MTENATKPQRVHFDEVVGPPMLAYDHELGCIVVAVAVKSGGEAKVLAMPEATAQALARWLIKSD